MGIKIKINKRSLKKTDKEEKLKGKWKRKQIRKRAPVRLSTKG